MNNRKVGSYRYCFVPMCKNTTKSAPHKVFVQLPRDEAVRRLWFRLARRLDKPTTTSYFCCEDHFVLKDDMENYVRFCLMGGPIKMKSGVVPRIFACQPDRQQTVPLRPASENRKRKADVAEILASAGCSSTPDGTEKENRIPNTSTAMIPTVRPVSENRKRKADVGDILASAGCSSTPDGTEKENRIPNTSTAMVPTVHNVEHETTNLDHLSNVCSDEIIVLKSFQHRGVQVNIRPHVRSKRISCKFAVPVKDASCSPIRFGETPSTSISQHRVSAPTNSNVSSASFFSSSLSSKLMTDSSDYKPHSEEMEDIKEIDKQQMQHKALTMTNYFISTNSKRYLGVQKEWMWIIDVLHSQTHIPADDIKLTLMKIKVNDTFERLSEQFGISSSQASIIFSFCLPRLAHILKTLIHFPKPTSVKKALPIPFRANFSHVQSIIDCFEIQIQKPTNSVNQALTWSEYKKANTLKYFISSSPDGFINFISKGYGGRISDTLITEQCGFIDSLPEGCGVMADRGFKQIQTLLNKKKCTLIRPPSVLSNVKPSKDEVLETKCIASLRIHIERVIGRVREYEILKPHSCIHHNLVPQVDDIVTIASALINLQTPIIRT